MKTLVVIAGTVAAILLFLLTSATANPTLFAQSYPLLDRPQSGDRAGADRAGRGATARTLVGVPRCSGNEIVI